MSSQEAFNHPLINQVYRHYKGGLYQVIAIGKHADDTTEHVVYRSMKDGQVWVRRLNDWNTPVGNSPRFVLARQTE